MASSAISSGPSGGGAVSLRPSADPRSLKDRATLHRFSAAVVSFFAQHDRTISPQALSSPSVKDYTTWILFLFRILDPGFKYDRPAPEEIPLLFRLSRYPFGLSSRSLESVGSQHTWPTFLAAMHWLTELLRYDSEASAIRAEDLQRDYLSPEALREEFFNYTAEAYCKAFMTNDDALDEEMERAFVDTLRARNEERKAAIVATEAQVEAIEAELAAISSCDRQPAVLEDRIAVFQRDIEKLTEWIANKARHNCEKEAALEDRRGHERARVAQIAESERRLAALRAALESQLALGIDATSLVAEVKRAQQDDQKAAADRKRLAFDCTRVQMEVEKHLDGLKDVMEAYQKITEYVKRTDVDGSAELAKKVSMTLGPDFQLEPSPAATLHELNAAVAAFGKAQVALTQEDVVLPQKLDEHHDRLRELRQVEATLRSDLEGRRAKAQSMQLELECLRDACRAFSEQRDRISHQLSTSEAQLMELERDARHAQQEQGVEAHRLAIALELRRDSIKKPLEMMLQQWQAVGNGLVEVIRSNV